MLVVQSLLDVKSERLVLFLNRGNKRIADFTKGKLTFFKLLVNRLKLLFSLVSSLL